MPTSQDALSRLVDEAGIRDATARFADTATRGDFDGFRRLWADDAVWTIAKPFEARVEAIVQMLHGLWDQKDFFVQFAVQGPVVIDGDETATSCICHEAVRGPGETYLRNHGIFFDRLRRSDRGWVFTGRSYEYLWLDTSPFTGEAFRLPSADAASAAKPSANGSDGGKPNRIGVSSIPFPAARMTGPKSLIRMLSACGRSDSVRSVGVPSASACII